MTKTFQLIYVSGEEVAFSQKDLEELLVVARRNNQQLGIGGLLIYDQGSFLQVLEGNKDDVLALYEKIEKDPRHKKIKTLLMQDVDTPQFAQWEMGFVNIAKETDLPEGYLDYKKDMSSKKKEGTLATRALESFLEGNWRPKVK